MLFGLLCAIAVGVITPVMMIFLGEIFDGFVENGRGNMTVPTFLLNDDDIAPTSSAEVASDAFMDTITEFLWEMIGIGAGTWVLTYLYVTCMNYAAERQVFRIRRMFLEAVLRQDIGWYDTNTSTDFASKMTQ